MITSQLSKQLSESLKSLRPALTEPTEEDISTVDIHSVYSDSELINDWQDDLFTERHLPIHREDLCYATRSYATYNAEKNTQACEAKIAKESYVDFYQDIAQAASEWTDKPSDRKKIAQALDYVFETAKTAPKVNNTLNYRLKHDEMMRIIENLVSYLNN